MAGRTYRYYQGKTLYPFGYGLTYTTFTLEGLSAERASCTVTVKNTGEMAGREVVQVYVESPGQKERYRLCGVAPVYLNAGESAKVKIDLASDAFSRRNGEGDLYEITGPHTLHIGFGQPDKRGVELCGVEPLRTVLH
jgi:beta-glucosidase